jgi:hypothetical protein
MNAKEYSKGKRFSTYELSYSVQVRDNKPAAQVGKCAMPGAQGIVMVFPTIGAGYATCQSPRQAVRLARKVVRFLNGEAKKS